MMCVCECVDFLALRTSLSYKDKVLHSELIKPADKTTLTHTVRTDDAHIYKLSRTHAVRCFHCSWN